MAATRRDIEEWFDRGVEKGASHLIVMCDTFDYDDYPVYVSHEEDVHEVYDERRAKSMQRVMEVYNLSMPKGSQMTERRAFNF